MKYLKTSSIATFTRATDGSAGFDLTACRVELHGAKVIVNFGVKVAIPEGYVGFLVMRSSTPLRYAINQANCIGVIDSDYRGELIGIYRHDRTLAHDMPKPNDVIAQLVVVPISTLNAVEIETETGLETPFKAAKKPIKRRKGGFGSTDDS